MGDTEEEGVEERTVSDTDIRPDTGWGALEGFENLRIATTTGGIFIMGPSAGPISGMESLLSSPEVEPMCIDSAPLRSWITAPPALMTMARDASRIVRSGKTAVLYLDSHLAHIEPLPLDLRDFASARLAQVLVGLADPPAYLGLHGRRMAKQVLEEGLGETESRTIGVIGDHLPVISLTERTMFPGLPVVICSGGRPATAMAQALDWFEARRS